MKTPFSPHSQSRLSWYKVYHSDPVALRKLLNLVMPQFPHLWSGGNDNIYLIAAALQNSIQPQWTKQKSNCSCPLKVLTRRDTKMKTLRMHLHECCSPAHKHLQSESVCVPMMSQAQETGGTRPDRFPSSLCSSHWWEGVNASMINPAFDSSSCDLSWASGFY